MKKFVLATITLLCFVFASKVYAGSIEFRQEEKEFSGYGSPITISVNLKGNLAISFQSFSYKVINVYNEAGEFLYSYRFNYDGIYSFRYDKEDNIELFLGRNNSYSKVYDEDGVHVADINRSSEELTELLRTYSYIKKIEWNGNEYLVKRLKVVKIDKSGKEIVFWKDSKPFSDGELKLAYLVVFFGGGTALTVFLYRKQRKNRQKEIEKE